jgi:hypothetical protein
LPVCQVRVVLSVYEEKPGGHNTTFITAALHLASVVILVGVEVE